MGSSYQLDISYDVPRWRREPPQGARLETDAGKAHPELQEKDYLCLYVQNEGHGVDPDTLKNAISPFFTTKGIGKARAIPSARPARAPRL